MSKKIKSNNNDDNNTFTYFLLIFLLSSLILSLYVNMSRGILIDKQKTQITDLQQNLSIAKKQLSLFMLNINQLQKQLIKEGYYCQSDVQMTDKGYFIVNRKCDILDYNPIINPKIKPSNFSIDKLIIKNSSGIYYIYNATLD